MAEAVHYAIASRRSIRGFLPDAVDHGTIARILAVASRAPSGSNVQPWRVHVLTGGGAGPGRGGAVCGVRGRRARGAGISVLSAEMARALSATPPRGGLGALPPGRAWRGATRRRGDRQRGRNFLFFGAPAALVFTIDRDLEQGSWLDYGMFLQSIMVAARGLGLDTCAQAAIASYPAVLRRELSLPDGEMIVCGMALGVADPAEPTNALVSEREPVAGFTTFHEA